jgi:hypothetical protein
MAVSKVSELPGLVTVASGTQFLAVDSGTTYNTTASNVATYVKSVNLPSVTSTLNTASPNNTNNVSGVTASGGTTNQFLALVPKGTGGIIGSIPDSTSTGGDARGLKSIDLQFTRNGATQVAGGSGSSIIGGTYNTIGATGYLAFVGGGIYNNLTGYYSAAVGGGWGSDRGQYQTVVLGSWNGANSNAMAQNRRTVLTRDTTSATPTVLLCDSGGVASATSQVVVAQAGVYAYRIQLVAATTGGTLYGKAWTITGAVKRPSNAASTALLGSPTYIVDAADSQASTWTVAITADTTNGTIAVTCTGQASTNIRWVATVETTESAS